MNKEFIPYEQALELKELGFDEPCHAYYESDGRLVYSAITNTNSFWAERSIVSAPLYQQAFRWFREKYGIIGWVEGKILYKYCIESHIPTDDQLNFSPFKTYEEAELACLIKLIEIVKEKK